MSGHYDRQTGDWVSDEDRGAATRQGRATSSGLTRLTGWLATAAIAASALITIAISAAGPNVSVPAAPRPGYGPPWWHPLHLTATFVTVSLWIAMVLGCAGVIAGLIAVARGARPPVRPILVAVFGVVAVLTVLPPAGSTDSISYAASRSDVNGRVTTPGT